MENRIRLKLLTEKELSKILGIPVSTLQIHRLYRTGIPFVKINKLVRYSVEAVKEYLDENTIHPE